VTPIKYLASLTPPRRSSPPCMLPHPSCSHPSLSDDCLKTSLLLCLVLSDLPAPTVVHECQHPTLLYPYRLWGSDPKSSSMNGDGETYCLDGKNSPSSGIRYRCSLSLDSFHAPAVMPIMTANATAVLVFQFFGWPYHPPAGDQTCFG
jgi:hypothetical protein